MMWGRSCRSVGRSFGRFGSGVRMSESKNNSSFYHLKKMKEALIFNMFSYFKLEKCACVAHKRRTFHIELEDPNWFKNSIVHILIHRIEDYRVC